MEVKGSEEQNGDMEVQEADTVEEKAPEEANMDEDAPEEIKEPEEEAAVAEGKGMAEDFSPILASSVVVFSWKK